MNGAGGFERLDGKLLLGYTELSFPLPEADIAFDPYRHVENLGKAVIFTELTGHASAVLCVAEVSPDGDDKADYGYPERF